MILRFDGIVNTYSDSIDVSIGGRNVIKEILQVNFPDKATIVIVDERFEGDLWAFEGHRGWSEWTPGDPAELTVGENNILDILTTRYQGQNITMWVADEPVNILEEASE